METIVKVNYVIDFKENASYSLVDDEYHNVSTAVIKVSLSKSQKTIFLSL